MAVPGGCSIVSVTVPNSIDASRVVHWPFGQPACCGVAIGVADGAVMLKDRLPFLI
jgi:hypothetical protein